MKALGMGAAVLASAVALVACGSSSSSSGGGSDTTAYCNQVKSIKAFSQSNPFAGLSPGDVQGAQQIVAKIKGQVDQAAAVAPDAIKSQVDQVQSFFADFNSKIAQAKTPQEFIQAAQTFQSQAAQLKKNVNGIKAYDKKTCGT